MMVKGFLSIFLGCKDLSFSFVPSGVAGAAGFLSIWLVICLTYYRYCRPISLGLSWSLSSRISYPSRTLTILCSLLRASAISYSSCCRLWVSTCGLKLSLTLLL